MMGKPATTRAAKKPAGDDAFNEICSIRIELLDTDPLIWREVEVPTSVSLKVLHDIVQITVGWSDYHLWQFSIGGQRFGPKPQAPWDDEAPTRDAAKVRLRDVLTPSKTVIDYVYDFGDSWEHRLTVSHIRPSEAGKSYPRYTGGEWAGPPEDSGGIPGFYDKLEAQADPNHPDHADIVEWLEGYDPKQINLLRVNFLLGRIANRRLAGRKRAGAPKR